MRPEGVLLVYDEAMEAHEIAPGHPERPERLRAVEAALAADAPAGVRWARPRPADRAAIERVHTEAYVGSIEALRGQSARLDADTGVSPRSVEAAYLAAGAAARAVEAVMRAEAGAAFALVRPPGHHAERDRAMGFCLFNNIAVAAEHARAALGAARVLIVDWDVHHGNGTQHHFEARGDVLFFSAHRYPFYPGTGALTETGRGEGAGLTVNAPLPAGLGDGAYALLFDEVLAPAAERFRPDLVLVSAGFDAHRDDPLGDMALTEAGFAALCGQVRAIAARHCEGRLALVLEGGYDLDGLARSARACVEVLCGAEPPAPPAATPHEQAIVRRIRDRHR